MSAITDELRDYLNEPQFLSTPALKRKVSEIADIIDYQHAMYASHAQATIDEMSELLGKIYQDMYDSGEYVEPYEEQLTRLGVIENAPQRLQIKVHDTASKLGLLRNIARAYALAMASNSVLELSGNDMPSARSIAMIRDNLRMLEDDMREVVESFKYFNIVEVG